MSNRSLNGPREDPAPANEPVTIGLVARAANVSRATVSRVMNGNTKVAPHLADRVRQAAQELGYEPSPVARSLALGRTGIVAMLVPDLGNPMFQGILHRLTEAAGDQNYRLLVADSNENLQEEPLLAIEARRRCDGLVLCAPRMPDEQLRELAPRLSPFVLINRELPESPAPTLTIDFSAGIRDILTHLLGLGHRRLAYLAGPDTSASNHARLETLRTSAGKEFDLVELPCGAAFADGHSVADQLVDIDVTAVIAYNDLVAFGVLSRLHELGISVPAQMSVVGFDDIEFVRYTTPPLTTVSVPLDQLGPQAWSRLWALMREVTVEPDVRFRPRLEVRGSTGPAPRD
ncbi:LacI family transcriptional regulator [Actinobacteria bacterium YIM 96077]|uniref:LacI family transcriptional regulator n=1 Tax=Phytoactinopolyspora halophila TaxID=1981511 RepID=A0A329R4I6_9ACTN|nr:LacI family DNA-binding transcriptional regulator [Phytoactinopolyspora halophila]AYY11499.1 LacI family transcriptional regulator [Actinobacteria bacterium YIM 96077]RAW18018.1 LacI family transcriptional regulator [Phytoactinopolyspora halophila]